MFPDASGFGPRIDAVHHGEYGVPVRTGVAGAEKTGKTLALYVFGNGDMDQVEERRHHINVAYLP